MSESEAGLALHKRYVVSEALVSECSQFSEHVGAVMKVVALKKKYARVVVVRAGGEFDHSKQRKRGARTNCDNVGVRPACTQTYTYL